ncbi:AAA family ATPase [Anaerocolumna xylanovorans]|uniref:AAA domain-containing protein, putative AbiEii toxin, Type IV TA system n=1 Tax=Anaerocolumna xylanovorans DSM 12503 TaxID=1121345 RepID=A0A1M7Y3B8_9FIRM|nr:AAA family ATPase [Anaerocolumna xylanovorans]SHO46681.1 AAA domain-containing protein, putative AbiEii toxin, Type IV TA system [Anaerocolumna xylanovorans DSM 12503]
MLYLTGFHLPGQYEMDLYRFTSAYPFGVFYFKELNHISFDRITIFYGGNGSGKSSLLNLISEKLELPRRTAVDRSKEFIDFLGMCSYSLNGEDGVRKIPEGSKIITSEDIIDGILNQRKGNKETGRKQEESFEEYKNFKFSDFQFTSMKDYDRLKKINQTRSITATKYIQKNAGEKTREFSNGENALRYFDKELISGKLYLLDEPENSLSPKYQYELTKLIFDMGRFFDVQFIIATHSPFLLSLEGARIYNLDEEPVETRRWEELESIRFYHEFFKKREHLF